MAFRLAAKLFSTHFSCTICLSNSSTSSLIALPSSGSSSPSYFSKLSKSSSSSTRCAFPSLLLRICRSFEAGPKVSFYCIAAFAFCWKASRALPSPGTISFSLLCPCWSSLPTPVKLLIDFYTTKGSVSAGGSSWFGNVADVSTCFGFLGGMASECSIPTNGANYWKLVYRT